MYKLVWSFKASSGNRKFEVTGERIPLSSLWNALIIHPDIYSAELTLTTTETIFSYKAGE